MACCVKFRRFRKFRIAGRPGACIHPLSYPGRSASFPAPVYAASLMGIGFLGLRVSLKNQGFELRCRERLFLGLVGLDPVSMAWVQ